MNDLNKNYNNKIKFPDDLTDIFKDGFEHGFKKVDSNFDDDFESRISFSNRRNVYLTEEMTVTPLGAIFRIWNKNTGKTWISYGMNPISTINNIFYQLKDNTFTHPEIQDDYNAEPKNICAEVLMWYYDEYDRHALINSYCHYFGGVNSRLLYNYRNIKNQKKYTTARDTYQRFNTMQDENMKYILSEINDLKDYIKNNSHSNDCSNCSLKNISNDATENISKDISETVPAVTKKNIDEILFNYIHSGINSKQILATLAKWTAYSTAQIVQNKSHITSDEIDETKKTIDNISTLNSIKDVLNPNLSNDVNFKSSKNEVRKRKRRKDVGKQLRPLKNFKYFDFTSSPEDYIEYVKKDKNIYVDTKLLNKFIEEYNSFFARNKNSIIYTILKIATNKKHMCLYDIADKLNVEVKKVNNVIDSLQVKFPALYLFCGFGRKSRSGKDKRCVKRLKDLNINIPKII